MSAHTPGPWRHVFFDDKINEILGADGESIMHDECYYPSAPSNPADWPLIAAAPELLAALRECVGVMEVEGFDAEAAAARAAIAKAEGRE